ncbi:hypothetical protein HFC70_24735 [Agrobacterium sp. a22-2]|uniref:hypothetical protein n=1 Tax=Agrobacterium sp. a22-2 TaxID=2283840 RepID=UPI0014479F4D|nr:hypothetical protein [Agrobacterium sp. a22-2]NKN39558.1 hypothetical protein [Agrobacterium sp. a22-2]
MLTKKQTLWAFPVLIVTFATLCLVGYISEEHFGRNAGLTALLVPVLIANIFAFVFICFSIFLSLGTALIFNTSSPEFWEKMGNPFYYLVWKELQEVTTQKPDRSDG